MTRNAGREVLLLSSVRLLVRVVFLGACAIAVALYIGTTLHWPMIQDSGVMHYVVFLLHHGLRPYSDITDNNLPGAYLAEQAAMAVFGGSDFGWRLYDFSLLAALLAAFLVIAWPVDWMAAVFAGSVFALQHGSDGVWFTAEREQVMTVLLAIGCALLLLAGRRRLPWLTGGFGFLAAMAASIKPTLAPLVLVLLGVLAAHRRREPHGQSWRYVCWGLAGVGAALALNVGFLLHHHAFGAFLYTLRTVTPVYAGLNSPGRRALVLHLLPFLLVPLFGLGALALLLSRRAWDWERVVLALVTLTGILSYLVQGKGFPYHRYLFLAFGLLWAGLEFLPSRRTLLLQVLGFAALLWAACIVFPARVQEIRAVPKRDLMTPAMVADLQALGGQQLKGQVQCFDMILGCLNALYHLRLVENTGFTGDMLLFARHANPATAYYQDLYTRLQREHPASVLVVTNEEFGEPNSFERLALWPAFAEDLRKNYRLAVTRSFSRQGKRLDEADAPPETALAYRIYLREGQAFPPLPANLPGSSPSQGEP